MTPDTGPATTDSCRPTTCAAAGAECGTVDDGCGTTLACGDCATPETCGGAGAANQCGCTATMTCESMGADCGSFTDDCDQTQSCGECAAPATCGGGGSAGRCGCTPTTTCASMGATCGMVTDDCGVMHDCGTCTALGETCGGGGLPNRCGRRLAMGEACDPSSDMCGTGLRCCTACCLPSATPVCTPTDATGMCALPDLTVDAAVLASSVRFETRSFTSSSCAFGESCVDATGSRRLMRFSTRTPNIGTADLHIGDPAGSPLFVFSPCHGHYHFNEYADYRLVDDTTGAVVDMGHKQAFCLIDLVPLSGTTTSARYGGCGAGSDQGIQVGWADEYNSGLDCQWIDITGVPAGTYTLEVHVNPMRIIPELRYDNNIARIPVTIVP